MKTRVIVIGISRYRFPHDQTGEIIEGTKVHYIEDNMQNEEHLIGHVPQSANLPYEYFDKMAQVPGVYHAELSISLISKRPSLKVNGFEFLNPVEFKTIHPAATVK